jgi:hypothetical protein
MGQTLAERLFADVHPTRFEGWMLVSAGIVGVLLGIANYLGQETAWIPTVGWCLMGVGYLYKGTKRLSTRNLDPDAEYELKHSVQFVLLILAGLLIGFSLTLLV